MSSITSQTADLSAAIVSFASAARKAQKTMSSDEYPMTIKEYKFEVNFSADYTFSNETEAKCTFWGIGLDEKINIGYSEKMGITINCTIVPAVTIVAGGSGS